MSAFTGRIPSHHNTPQSVLNAPTPQLITLTAVEATQPSERLRRVLERRAARKASK